MNALKQITGWRLLTALFSCCLCLTIGLNQTGRLAQAASPFFWDSINVDMTLEANGDLLVTETQKYVFTANHTRERYRYIPLDGIDSITDVAVYENNEPLAVETGERGKNYWIRWQHRLNAPEAHTFKIQYRVVGGIQVKGNRSQLYWNALFPERSAPINTGKVTLQVPENLAGKITSFRGEGVASRDRKLNFNTFEFALNGPLAPQQALNIRVKFPSNILTLSQPQTAYWSAKKSPLASFFALAGPGAIMMSVVGAIVTIRKRCPNCGQLSLNRTNRVVKAATRYSQGTREVNHTCQRCNYDRRFTQKISRKSSSSSNSHSGWGGYDGGGSSGGSSGCGGGGCGGGGGGCGGGG